MVIRNFIRQNKIKLNQNRCVGLVTNIIPLLVWRLVVGKNRYILFRSCRQTCTRIGLQKYCSTMIDSKDRFSRKSLSRNWLLVLLSSQPTSARACVNIGKKRFSERISLLVRSFVFFFSNGVFPYVSSPPTFEFNSSYLVVPASENDCGRRCFYVLNSDETDGAEHNICSAPVKGRRFARSDFRFCRKTPIARYM